MSIHFDRRWGLLSWPPANGVRLVIGEGAFYETLADVVTDYQRHASVTGG